MKGDKMVIDADVKAALTALEALSTTKGYVSREKIYDRMVRVDPPMVVSGVTKANPGVCTTTENHGLTDGDNIYFEAMDEMTELNQTTSTIIVTGVDTFSIQDTSGYGNAETTGGLGYQVGKRIVAVTGITSANPGVVTTDTDHGLLDDDEVSFYGLQEMTELNTATKYKVTYVTSTTFSIIDTSDYDAEVSGGYLVFEYQPRSTITTITSANPGVVTTSGAHGLSTGDIVYLKGINSGYVVITGITDNGSTKCRCAYTTSDQFLPVIADDIVIAGSDVAAYNTTHEITAVNLGVTFDTDQTYTTNGAACTGESDATTMEDLNDTSVTATVLTVVTFSIGDQSAKMKGSEGFCAEWPGEVNAAKERVDDHLESLSDSATRYARSGLTNMGRLGYKTI